MNPLSPLSKRLIFAEMRFTDANFLAQCAAAGACSSVVCVYFVPQVALCRIRVRPTRVLFQNKTIISTKVCCAAIVSWLIVVFFFIESHIYLGITVILSVGKKVETLDTLVCFS